jgi:hypothetical protein
MEVIMPPVTPQFGSWNISIRAQTAMGPWAFSLHIFAKDRAEAEASAQHYMIGLFALSPTSFRTARVMFESSYYEQTGPRVYQVKASTGDCIVR